MSDHTDGCLSHAESIARDGFDDVADRWPGWAQRDAAIVKRLEEASLPAPDLMIKARTMMLQLDADIMNITLQLALPPVDGSRVGTGVQYLQWRAKANRALGDKVRAQAAVKAAILREHAAEEAECNADACGALLRRVLVARHCRRPAKTATNDPVELLCALRGVVTCWLADNRVNAVQLAEQGIIDLGDAHIFGRNVAAPRHESDSASNPPGGHESTKAAASGTVSYCRCLTRVMAQAYQNEGEQPLPSVAPWIATG